MESTDLPDLNIWAYGLTPKDQLNSCKISIKN